MRTKLGCRNSAGDLLAVLTPFRSSICQHLPFGGMEICSRWTTCFTHHAQFVTVKPKLIRIRIGVAATSR